LAIDLNGAEIARAQARRARGFDPDDYPTPPLDPKGGFTLDRALVYAVVRQESRFDPYVVSYAGAIGLMQLMPHAAARAAGDDKLLSDTTPLYDASFNLRVGQDYLDYLGTTFTGGDVLRTIAAYNGGPGALQKAQQSTGDGDALMVIESMPAAQTRDYVERVMAAYWIYRRVFGESSRSIDMIASGANHTDMAADR
jgi:soluble lytic murein transglycosylase-like protein